MQMAIFKYAEKERAGFREPFPEEENKEHIRKRLKDVEDAL